MNLIRASFIPTALLGLVLALSGCVEKTMSDLTRFTQNAHKDRKPRVEPLPRIKPYEKFSYTAAALTDPFSAGNLGRLKPTPDRGEGPDPSRRKEPLEQYPLDSLRMVGTLSKQDIAWAVIRAPDGTIHRAAQGNYVGQNFGRIEKVNSNNISIREMIYNGKWIEREATLAIVK